MGKYCHIVMEVSFVVPCQDLKHYVYSFSIHCPVCQAVHESSRLCLVELQLQNERLLYFCLPFFADDNNHYRRALQFSSSCLHFSFYFSLFLLYFNSRLTSLRVFEVSAVHRTNALRFRACAYKWRCLNTRIY